MLITFEGTEGSGKSTLIRNLSLALTQKKIAHIVTREPGGSSVAESIREILLHQEMDPMTELFLYEAARAEHFQKTVLPALRQKKIVLCDRFIDSTVAYQGFARGLDLKTITQLNSIATEKRKPNLTFFLDLPVKVGLERASDPNRFEREGVRFQEKVRKGFLASIAKNRTQSPKRWVVLNVHRRTPDEICQEALAVILKKRGSRR